MSDANSWGRDGPGLFAMNALTVPIGEKINYFTPANTTTVLEINPSKSGVVVVEVEGGTFRCRVGLLSPRVFTAESDDNRLTIAGHPYTDGDGALRVSNSGGALPGGLVADVDAFVGDVTTNTFRLFSDPQRRILLTLATDGTGTNSIGGDNGAGNDVGFQPLAPVASAAIVLAIGGKLLRSDELQAFDAPVSIVGVTGAADLLSFWVK